MQFTHEIEQMCCVKKGCNHGPAPIPQEGNWTQSREITDISGLTHGVGWCAPQQGTCKLTLNVKNGIVEEALQVTGFAKENLAMVGDRLYTDIETGLRSGMLSILVMSGETTEEMLAESKTVPNLKFGRLSDMNELL